jgi:hypothetical protein
VEVTVVLGAASAVELDDGERVERVAVPVARCRRHQRCVVPAILLLVDDG